MYIQKNIRDQCVIPLIDHGYDRLRCSNCSRIFRIRISISEADNQELRFCL